MVANSRVGSTVQRVKDLPPHVMRAHEEAVSRGDDGYIDPDSGLYVMTAKYLAEREFCCGSGCRHCPYGVDEHGDTVLLAVDS